MGLGLHGGGVGAAKFFVQVGARVTVTDLRTKRQLKESIKELEGLPASNASRSNAGWPIKYVLGGHQDKDFAEADLIIRNPAVSDDSPYLKIAREHNVPIDTDVGIFFATLRAATRRVELCPTRNIIGVTGTRGKSTTATLIYELLKTWIRQTHHKKYENVVLAGNIRKSVLLELPHLTKKSIIVLELSSWQLEGLAIHKKSPRIAVVTTILPDHLNRYKNMRSYINAKKIIFKYQTSNDYLFLNKNDKIVSRFAGEAVSKIIFFKGEEARKYQTNLPGNHNLINIAAAVKVASHFGVPEADIQKVIKNFRGLEGRIELAAEIKGVKYINDTCATTPDATIAAIQAITPAPQTTNPKKIILIAGGTDKKLDFKELAWVTVKKVKVVILLPGTATGKLEKSMKLCRQESAASSPWRKKSITMSRNLKIVHVAGMKKAAQSAALYAKRGDTVLLSPACASFGLFRHEFERGDEFKKAVCALKNAPKNKSK